MILDQELSGEMIAQTIHSLYNHPEERAKMEEAIHAVGETEGRRRDRGSLLCIGWKRKTSVP